MPRPVPGRTVTHLAAAGMAAVLVLVPAGDAPYAAGGAAGYPDRSMTVLDDQFAVPRPVPEPGGPDAPDGSPAPDPPPLTDAEPDWEVELPADLEPRALATTTGGYVVRTRERLVGLDSGGEPRWEHELGERPDARVGTDVVVASRVHPTDDRWPQPRVIVALDPETGETLWEEEEASFWAAFEGTVYMSVCYGGQNDRIGDCQLSARDPRTNTVRWTTPTYASAQVRNDGGSLQLRDVPPYLVVDSYPTGYTSRIATAIDPATGQELGVSVPGHRKMASAPDTLVVIDDYDDNPADGCTAELAGYDLRTGDEVWTHTSTTGKDPDGVYCGRHSDRDAADGWLAVTGEDGTAAVLDAATGEVTWTAPGPGWGLAATGDVLVALDTSGDREAVVLYDLAAGEERWTAPGPPWDGEETATMYDEVALVYWPGTGGGSRPVGYDLATGTPGTYLDWSVRDAFSSRTDDRLVACAGISCSGYRLRDQG